MTLLVNGKKKSPLIWYNEYCRDKQKPYKGALFMTIINDNDNIYNLEIIEGTGEILSDIGRNGKERPWQMHKVGSSDLVELFSKARKLEPSIISDSRLQDLKDCGSFLEFKQNTEQKLKLAKANFCRLRLCPMCSWRKSLKLFSQVSDIATEFLSQQPSARFLFVTLTVPNCVAIDLPSTIDRMNKAFTYLTSSRQTFAPAKIFKKNLLGYMKAIEITYNSKENTYHPHIHCLFAVRANYFKGNEYIRKSVWQDIWSKAMKSNKELIVHIETVKNSSTAKAVAEVGKYPVKSADLLKIQDKGKATKALIVLHKALRNRRLVTFGGLMADIKKELKLEDIESKNIDLVHVDEEAADQFKAIRLVMFKWHVKLGVYIC